MARLRLIALCALAACGQADAQAPAVASGIKPPAGWQVLPQIAKASAEAAQGPGVFVAGSEAWGEPARGCYAVWLSLSGSGVTADRIVAGITDEAIITSDVVAPTGETKTGLVSLTFTKPPYTGRLRARIAEGSVTALACFANQREPVACTTACTTLLGALP